MRVNSSSGSVAQGDGIEKHDGGQQQDGRADEALASLVRHGPARIDELLEKSQHILDGKSDGASG